MNLGSLIAWCGTGRSRLGFIDLPKPPPKEITMETCHFCHETIKIYRSTKAPVWKAECSCAYVEHPHITGIIERHRYASEKHIKNLSDHTSS